MSNIDKQAQKELYAKVEQQAHSLRGNPREYLAATGMCPVNVIEMHAQKIQALLDELEAANRRNAELNSTLERWATDRAQSASELDDAEKRIAELEAREVVLPPRYSMLYRDGFDEPYHTVFVYKQHQVIEVLQAAGIRINGEG